MTNSKVCDKPVYKTYTGLVEQFEYCESCGEKKSTHPYAKEYSGSGDALLNMQLQAYQQFPIGTGIGAANSNAPPASVGPWQGGISPQTQPSAPPTRAVRLAASIDYASISNSIRNCYPANSVYLYPTDYVSLTMEVGQPTLNSIIYLAGTSGVIKVFPDALVPKGIFFYD